MKLRQIISNLLSSKDSSSHEFIRLWNLASFGMQTKFNLDVKGKIKSVLIDVSPNKTAQFPCDYVRYIKMGIPNSVGELALFKRNNQLTNYHASYYQNVDNLAGLPQLPSYGYLGGLNGYGYNDYLFLNYYYGTTTFNLFGLGSGTVDIGNFTIDETAKVISFGPNFYWSGFVLEYLSDGCDDDEDYDIDIRMAEAVKSWLRWQDVIDRPRKASPSAVAMLKRDYYNEQRLAKMRINPLVVAELQNAERRSWKLVAKA